MRLASYVSDTAGVSVRKTIATLHATLIFRDSEKMPINLSLNPSRQVRNMLRILSTHLYANWWICSRNCGERARLRWLLQAVSSSYHVPTVTSCRLIYTCWRTDMDAFLILIRKQSREGDLTHYAIATRSRHPRALRVRSAIQLTCNCDQRYDRAIIILMMSLTLFSRYVTW